MARIPPSIRVFISSTFSDMETERNYFNTVIAPRLRNLCADRGVSFFSVDLRWGITVEDQINGQVLPICLKEIDNCRPHFIGIIGNRYGSTVEEFPAELLSAFPWLAGCEGTSVTELEMLYGVLRNEADNPDANCVFLFRKDNAPANEPPESTAKLNSLIDRIKASENIPSHDYGDMEEFEGAVIAAFTRWLDRYFPTAEAVKEVRKRWYNEELLRNYTDSAQMHSFLDNYCQNSSRPLLIHGEGSRGKTTFLTNWQPREGKKILVNCGSDRLYHYWPNIAHAIVNELNAIDENAGYPDFKAEATMFFSIFGKKEANYDGSVFYVTDKELDSFRRGFVRWLRNLKINTPVYIVINDLDLISDSNSRYLNWLPAALPQSVHLICSSNHETVLENARLLGWNEKEMLLSSADEMRTFFGNFAGMYGKKLGEAHEKSLLESHLMMFPGYAKFFLQFLNIHARFDSLDTLTAAAASLEEPTGLYEYVLEYMLRDAGEERLAQIHTALALLASTTLELTEDDCYALVASMVPLDLISWSEIRPVLEQFDAVNGDYWCIKNPAIKEFVQKLPVDFAKVHGLLGAHFRRLLAENGVASDYAGIRRGTEYSKALLSHYMEAHVPETLCECLKDRRLLHYLSKLDWKSVRVAWMHLFMGGMNIAPRILLLYRELKQENSPIEGIYQRLCGLLHDLEQPVAADVLKRECGLEYIGSFRTIDGDSISEEAGDVYNALVGLKAQRQFKAVIDTADDFLAERASSLKPYEKCIIYRLKLESELQLQLTEDGITSAKLYYAECIRVMNNYETITALMHYSQCLYQSEKYEDAMQELLRAKRLAFSEGALREYLSIINMEAMCCYHLEDYNRAILLFDYLSNLWTRLGNAREAFTVLSNRCIAVHLSGDTEKALEAATKICLDIEAEGTEKYPAVYVKALGNVAKFSAELDRFETAEATFLKIIQLTRGSVGLPSAISAYDGLIKLYKSKSLSTKAADTYEPFLEYLFEAKLYGELASALREYTDLLQHANYSDKAKEVEKKWIAAIRGLPNGEEIIERLRSRAADGLSIERLREQFSVAKSEGDIEKCAKLAMQIGDAETDPIKSMESYTTAAGCYDACGNAKDALYAVCCAVSAVFRADDAGIMQEKLPMLYPRLPKEEQDALKNWLRMKEIAKRIGHNQYINAKTPVNEEYSALALTVAKQLAEGSIIADMCMKPQHRYIPYLCTESDLMAFTETVLPIEKCAVLLYYVAVAAGEDMQDDISYLMSDYLSRESEQLIAYYEKIIAFFVKADTGDAAALSGNLALIFRRRGDRDKTIRYHSLSMELYLKKEALRDYYIEAMNLATAHRDFDDVDSAIRLLREKLAEEKIASAPDMQACIAGNLASTLMSVDAKANATEIAACFKIEEAYFDEANEERELTISLINQLKFYLFSETGTAELLHAKYNRAWEITQRRNLSNFVGVLEAIKDMIDKIYPASGDKGDTDYMHDLMTKGNRANFLEAKRELAALLSRFEALELQSIEEETTVQIHGVLTYKEKLPATLVNIHILLDSLHRTLRCIFATQPQQLQGNAMQLLRDYAQWWNGHGDYQIQIQEDGFVMISEFDATREDWESTLAAFGRMVKLWGIDSANIAFAALGVVDLDTVKKLKEDIISGGE